MTHRLVPHPGFTKVEFSGAAEDVARAVNLLSGGYGIAIQHEVLFWCLRYGESFYWVRSSPLRRFRRLLSERLLDLEIAKDNAMDWLVSRWRAVRLRWMA